MAKTAINPTRKENYPEWYLEVIKASDLAENAPVRGCMVIKPWGYALWENIQQALDRMFKDTGHVNAYFPLLIPLSFLQAEADHVDGFAKECAVVTHHRLKADENGQLVADGELEEPLIIRPTSETIIGHMFAKWVQSYRDLPLLMNQWCNVMRWEMRPRMFLRTTEFLWQEGHTVHATQEEALEETRKMLEVYRHFAQDYMAMPVIAGEKTADERFPGAVKTYTIEAMMQDLKALQAGTSHFLGQNFARAQGIKFLSAEGKEEIAWTTSWGVSTRLIGGLIMTHSDDDGLILPPRLAPKHVVIMPIYRNDQDRAVVMEFVDNLKKELNSKTYHGQPLRFEVDDRDSGAKHWYHIKRGVPIRLEIGPRDVASQSVFMGRRDFSPKEKKSLDVKEFIQKVSAFLDEIQSNLFNRAQSFRDDHLQVISNRSDFENFFEESSPGGFARVFWSEKAIGHELLERYKVTPRCIPLDQTEKEGTCLFTGEKTKVEVIFAKSY